MVGPRGGFDNFAGQRLSDMSPELDPGARHPLRHARSGKKAAIGLGVFAPYGLTTEWPTSFEGRFTAYETTLKSPMIQPTFAYKFNDAVSIGIGLDVAENMVELNQRLDLSTQQLAPGITFAQIGVPKFTDFADFNIKGDTRTFGFNLGFLVKPPDEPGVLRRAVHEPPDREARRPRSDVDADQHQPAHAGPAARHPGGHAHRRDPRAAVRGRRRGSANQTAATEIPLPEQLIVGVGIRPAEKWLLALDLQWVNWSLFESLDFVTSNGLEENDQQAVRGHGRSAVRRRVPGQREGDAARRRAVAPGRGARRLRHARPAGRRARGVHARRRVS